MLPGKERVRLEGYLPNNDFMAALKNGLGRIAFVQKKYADAERWYGDVVAQYGDSHFAPEAMYWRAVAQYSASHDHTVLGKSRRGTAKQISVQRVGEQGDSVAALENSDVSSPQFPRLSSSAGFLLLASDNGVPAEHTTVRKSMVSNGIRLSLT